MGIVGTNTKNASDQKQRLEAILENRNRNFETTNNLLTPSMHISLTPLNATARPRMPNKEKEK